MSLPVSHLFDVPFGIKQAQVYYPNIGPHAFNFLDIPERKGIVIAIGKQKRILFHGIEQVIGIIAGHIPIASVVAWIVLISHPKRNSGHH